jgi:hypothetical protein
MYSKYKDTLNVILKNGKVFTIPLYHQNKIDSQCTTFIISGTIMQYEFSVKRHIFTDRHYICQPKGNYVCDSNKRQTLDKKNDGYIAYTTYVFNNLKSGDDYQEIELMFCFTEKYQQDMLNILLRKSAGKAISKITEYVKEDDAWKEISTIKCA